MSIKEARRYKWWSDQAALVYDWAGTLAMCSFAVGLTAVVIFGVVMLYRYAQPVYFRMLP